MINIIATGTEEEGVLSIVSYLTKADYEITLYIEESLNERISGSIPNSELVHTVEVKDRGFLDFYKKNSDLFFNRVILIPRIDINSYLEISDYKEFFKKNSCYLGLLDREKWLATYSEFLKNFLKNISLSYLRDKIACEILREDVYGFLMFELDRNPDSRMISEIRDLDKDQIIFPFKQPHQSYDPIIKDLSPKFVITGNIQKKRRNYDIIMETFSSKDFESHSWSLTLLGRPIGDYGHSIIEKSKMINQRLDREAIKFFSEYIPKEEFDRQLSDATHLIAPLNTSLYRHGKTSGAIYDAFALNKHLIMPKVYFDETGFIGRDTSIKYESEGELSEILRSIILTEYDYSQIKDSIPVTREYIQDINYIKYIQTKLSPER